MTTPDKVTPLSEDAQVQEGSPLARVYRRLSHLLFRMRRRLPYLVWRDDEVDVCVTIKGIGALSDGSASKECIFEAQRLLNDIGVRFDTGSGMHGRDWEWDFSLRGPISVRFRRVTKNPEVRTARPKPELKLVKS